VRPVGGLQGDGAAGLDGDPGAVVRRRGGVHGDPGMPVLVVVIPEEIAAENVDVLDGAEFSRERGAVLECFVVNTNVEGGRWQFTGRGAV